MSPQNSETIAAMTASRPRRWRDEYAPGRVFELRRKTYDGHPVCALAIREYRSDTGGSATYFVQVDGQGCTEGPYARSQSRTWVGGIRPRRMTSALIARRRPDLERFDAEDLALIRYGAYLEFGGRIRTDGLKGSIPPLSGKTWTVFWTKCDWRLSLLGTARAELASLLRGHWHMHSRCGGDWTFGRDSHLAGWATVDTDRARLRRIEAHLRRHLSHVEVQTIAMTAVNERDIRIIRAHGRPCPAIRSQGITTIRSDGTWGYSLSLREDA